MKAILVTVGLLAGGLMLTGALASALQAHAVAGHRVDPTYAPDAEATTDRWGWPAPPKSEQQPSKASPDDGGPPASWHNQAQAAD